MKNYWGEGGGEFKNLDRVGYRIIWIIVCIGNTCHSLTLDFKITFNL